MIFLEMTRRTFLISSIAATTHFAFGQEEKLKVGCQLNGWGDKQGAFDGLVGVIQSAKEFGYTGFECNIRFVSGEFERAAEARKRLQATGMQFIGVHTSLTDAEKPGFADLAKGASQLGAKNVVLSAAGLAPDGKFTPEALHAKVARVEAIAKVCQANGVQLAYHNHMPEFANDNAEIQGLADSTNPELVYFLMDAGHGYQGGGDPAAFMLHNSARIVGCHLKTFVNHTQQVPLGSGEFGFEALATAIRRARWKGWLIDEEGGGPSGSNTAAVGPDREYIRKIFGV
jgi:sugar phosphate isomerase/epimerase